MEWFKLRGRSSSYGESVLEKEERRRKGERKKRRKKTIRKDKGRKKFFLHCFQIWVDQELVLHTSRGEGFFLPVYFLLWGHGNGIWLSWFVIT